MCNIINNFLIQKSSKSFLYLDYFNTFEYKYLKKKKMNTWIIDMNIGRRFFNAHRVGDSKKYMCNIVNYNKISILDNLARNLPILPIVDKVYKNNKTYIFYERTPILKESNRNIIRLIIRSLINLIRFHYTSGYCICPLNLFYSLFIKDERIYFNPTYMAKMEFSEMYYLFLIRRLFKKLNKKTILRKLIFFTEDQTYIRKTKDKQFFDLIDKLHSL